MAVLAGAAAPAGAQAPAAAPVPKAGVESVVELPGGGGRMLLFAPSNYDPARKWPVVFFYHGQGGSPSTALLRRLTGEQDYLVAAMPYIDASVKTRPAPEMAEYVRKELQNLRNGEEWVVRHAAADPKRLFLSGSSMGGWTTSLLGDQELPRLAGLAILLAGRVRTGLPTPAAAVFQNKPVYLGDGETDTNLSAARHAAEFYRRMGAAVTFEEFPGVGHAVPDETPRLRAWLDARGRLASADPAARQELTAWYSNAWAAVQSEKDPARRYVRATDLAEDPRLGLFGPATRAGVQGLLQKLRSGPPGRDEWAAEQGYRSQLWAEMAIQRLDDLRSVRDGLRQVAMDYPNTRWGRYAAQDFERVSEVYDKSVAATRQANAGTVTNTTPRRSITPSFPSSGIGRSGIPVPRRVGDRIIFHP